MPMQMGFRWYGEGNDKISLSDIRQIPGVSTIVWALHDKMPGEVWQPEEIDKVVSQIKAAGFNADVVESVCADRLNTVGRKVKTVSQKDSRFSKNCVLNARKMWLRRYRNMGWTVEQCERTLQEVRRAVRQFGRGGLPCRLVRA